MWYYSGAMILPARKFYMIRHGQTEANAQQIMAGSLDSPLTEFGRQQAMDVHHALDHMPEQPTKIIHSHLSRARDTASLINLKLGLEMQEEAGIAEWHAGDWEGVPYEQCGDIMRSWIDAPGGESSQDFLSRIRAAKHRILSEDGHTPLLVSHGGVFRALAKLYDIDIHGVRNAVLYEFEPTMDAPHFPWDVWRYDVPEEDKSAVSRNRVIFDPSDPTSEIAR